MSPILKLIGLELWASTIGFAVLCGVSFGSQAMAQTQEGTSRQIVLDEFMRARPVKSTETPAAVTNSKARGRKRPPAAASLLNKRPTYRRASGGSLAASTQSKRPGLSAARPAGSEELGVTLWRLRPAKQNDSGARLLVMESAQSGEWTPERMEVETPLEIGEGGVAAFRGRGGWF